MNFEMKEINKTMLLSWLSIIGVLAISYIDQVIRHERTVMYLVVFICVMIIPWIVVYLIYKKRPDWSEIGHMIVIGYMIMYTFVMLTGRTQMVAIYILPLLSFLILYHEPKLIINSFLATLIVNIISVIPQYRQGLITSENFKDVEIRFAAIFICFAGAFVSARLYERVHHERVNGELAALKAGAANDAKSEFLAHMSHEIRTPINAVIGKNTMILRETDKPKIKEYALDIQRAALALLSIINGILDISKIESGKMEIIPVDYDFSSLVNDAVNMVQDKARSKDLSLEVDVDSSIPCTMHGDDIRVRQVLVNILNNAVKYTDEGSVTLSINGTKKGDIETLHVSIKDTGIGIKDEDLDKLFGEFERIEDLRNRHVEGTGLGMSITINLLEMMGAKLNVKSEYGVGSEFYFDLDQGIIDDEPIGDIASRIAAMAEEYAYETTFSAPDAKVLVVDDNRVNLSVFCDLVKEIQLKVDTSVNGREALDLIRENKYDIIFVDHMMPDMDGIEVMHRIAEDDTHMNVGVPVIALTANAIVGAREKYISEGFKDYLSKPIMPDKLEKLISDYLPEDKIIIGAPKVPEGMHNSGHEHDGLHNSAHHADHEEVTLPQIEGINWEYAKLHLGNTEAILRTVKTVYNAMGSDANEISAYYDLIFEDNENMSALDSYRIKIHSIKSTAALLGCVPIAGMAAILENAAKSGDINKILDINPYFVSEFKRFKEKLKTIAVGESEAEKQEITDKEEVADIVKNLISCVADFDVHGADIALENISSYKYNEEVDGLIEMISGAVSNLDPDKVESLGNELIEKIHNL